MSAIISPCGLYRYRLERDCGMPFEGSKTFAYFGINPSTADSTLDDATVRKWKGFTVRNGGHRFIVGNAFAFRSTDVGGLRAHYISTLGGGGSGLLHSQSEREVSYWAQIAADADVLVPCWGNSAKVPAQLRGRLAFLLGFLAETGKPIMHFGLTASGDPKHPLMLGYDTPLAPWVNTAQQGEGGEK